MRISTILEHMSSKSGWGSGENQPIETHTVRDQLIHLLQRHLPENCPVEPLAFNRGMDYSAIILWRPKNSTTHENLGDCPPEAYACLDELETAGRLFAHLSLELEIEDTILS